MPVKELSFAFAIPKFHLAEKQGKNHYQRFLSLFSIAPKKLADANLFFRSYKKTTLPAIFVGRAVIYKKKHTTLKERSAHGSEKDHRGS
jgi:hypothetical protein